MSGIEQDIKSIIERLEARQSELAGQYGVVTRIIETLQASLSDLASLPLPTSDAGESTTRLIEKEISDVQEARNAAAHSVLRTEPAGLADSATYFNLSQSQAIIKLMRLIKRPVTMLEILAIFKEANYTIKAKVPYQSLFSVMTRDKAFVKQGKLWGLKEWSSNGNGGLVEPPRPVRRIKLNLTDRFDEREQSPATGAGSDDSTSD